MAVRAGDGCGQDVSNGEIPRDRGIRDGSVKKYLVWPWPGGGVRGSLPPMVADSHKNGIAYAVFTAIMAL